MAGTGLPPALVRLARLILFPVSGAWAAANRFNLLPEAPVGTSPHLDPVALGQWRKIISASKVYLEYGSGGSTFEAVKSASHVVSVETDRRYLSVVERKIRGSENLAASFHPIHVDIGWTEKWGRPLWFWKTRANVARWRAYSGAPWERLAQLGQTPDFIFVDGRFRVASVLESFLRLPEGSTCRFMLDDFDRRKENYKAILTFATNVETVGRALVFCRDPKFNRGECSRLLAVYQKELE